MKRTLILFVGLILFSCGKQTNNQYEQTIANCLQTSKSGTKFDYGFKALVLNEIQKITVADSVNTLDAEFEKYRKQYILNLRNSIATDRATIEKERSSKISSGALIEILEKSIARDQAKIDSLNSVKPTESARYNSRKPDEVLVVAVRCKYSVVIQGQKAEETFDFYLSPDCTQCYRKQRAK